MKLADTLKLKRGDVLRCGRPMRAYTTNAAKPVLYHPHGGDIVDVLDFAGTVQRVTERGGILVAVEVNGEIEDRWIGYHHVAEVLGHEPPVDIFRELAEEAAAYRRRFEADLAKRHFAQRHHRPPEGQS